VKLKGQLPVIRLTAIIVTGAIDNRVRVLGPKGGGNRPSSAPRARRKFVLRRRGANRAMPRMSKAA